MKKVLIAKFRNNHTSLHQNRYCTNLLTNKYISINEIVEDLIKDGVEHSRETMMEIIMLYNRKSAYIINSEFNLNRSIANPRTNLQEKLRRNNSIANMKEVDASTTEAHNSKETEIEHLAGINAVKLAQVDIKIKSHQKEQKTNVVLSNTNNEEQKIRIIKNTETIPACGILFHNWLYKS